MNMASFAGNIGFKISCQLPSRVSSISWIMWKGQIACLKSRDFISYVPLRYISRTSSKVIISETPLLVKSLEKSSFSSRPDVSVPKINCGKGVHGRIAHCESQNLNEIHNNLLLDDNEQGWERMEEVTEAVEELTIHPAGDSCKQDLLQNDKFTDAEESAIKLLAARALTTVELRKKLHAKRFSTDAVEAVINKFQSRGLINDRLYAEAFSRSRWSSSSWGPKRIKQNMVSRKNCTGIVSVGCDTILQIQQNSVLGTLGVYPNSASLKVPHRYRDKAWPSAEALFKKGVSQADAEKAVELVFKDNDSDADQKSIISLSKNSMDHLYSQASKQWLRGQDVPKETRKARIVRWLQYRGFDWDVINLILRKLDKQDPP